VLLVLELETELLVLILVACEVTLGGDGFLGSSSLVVLMTGAGAVVGAVTVELSSLIMATVGGEALSRSRSSETCALREVSADTLSSSRPSLVSVATDSELDMSTAGVSVSVSGSVAGSVAGSVFTAVKVNDSCFASTTAASLGEVKFVEMVEDASSSTNMLDSSFDTSSIFIVLLLEYTEREREIEKERCCCSVD
jgi:hypothetical protein